MTTTTETETTPAQMAHEYAAAAADAASKARHDARQSREQPDYTAAGDGMWARRHDYQEAIELASAALTHCALRRIACATAAEAVAIYRAR